ncbi:nicotinate-nucleotide pyrophosphorylase (carboxylating) [Natronospira proteinivora]|uniref:nicotinate-nucleotide diphosphorylase (carboxylating) n=1 Tax=Natronospira proteinivora TaxID=1807133 RepID=A0ABT1G4L2_9GAMM|nr:carboxylating nicotinate-nucleotide diphosphorylase [Natronospira proteinivora]MCP1726236.1 nicotinate-nucleotide pyrophosphorylase (carboxylating) [Natronospira proteinivora]
MQIPDDLTRQVTAALDEDLGQGDLTAALIPESNTARGRIITREAAVFCGQPWADAVFKSIDPGIQIHWNVADGDAVQANQVLCTLSGPARVLLSGERTALNFLQTLSSTATATRRLVEAVAGTGCTILDTRKTLPGLRTAQKYAVRCGGGENHRTGLFDGILIKENHIAACGGIAPAVSTARDCHPGIPVEVEVENLAEVEQALAAGADSLLLDNLSLEQLSEAVALNQGRAKLEASGGLTEAALAQVAATGVNYISVGALTKHIRAVDLSMRLE